MAEDSYGPLMSTPAISTMSVHVEHGPPKTRWRRNRAHSPLRERLSGPKDTCDSRRRRVDDDDHPDSATEGRRSHIHAVEGHMQSSRSHEEGPMSHLEGPMSVMPPVGAMLWSLVEAAGSMIFPVRVSDYAYDTVWKSAPRGTSLTHAVPVKRLDAYDADKIASIQRSLTQCDLVRRWLPEAEVSSLKPVVAALVNVGHTGYLCINVEHGNRLIWLE